MKKYYLQVYHHTLSTGPDKEWIDIGSLVIHPALAKGLAELGILEICDNRIQACQTARVQKLIRLHYSLDVDLHAAAIILDLLERIEKLQDKIEHFGE